MPYIGYFQLINAVDRFVVLDDVQFTRKGWTHRNNILFKEESVFCAHLFSIPLEGASQSRLISEINRNSVEKFANKFLSTLKQNYSRAPYFKDVFPLIVGIVENRELNLSKYNLNSLREVCSYLDIKTEFYVSSCIEKKAGLQAEDRIIEICKTQNAQVYINPIGGLNLYTKEHFSAYGISLYFLKTNPAFRYKQFSGEFVPNLSILDILMFVSKEEIKDLLIQFTLVESEGAFCG